MSRHYTGNHTKDDLRWAVQYLARHVLACERDRDSIRYLAGGLLSIDDTAPKIAAHALLSVANEDRKHGGGYTAEDALAYYREQNARHAEV